MADGFWQPFGELIDTLFVEGYLGGGSILMAQICTFAETANVNYRLSFADQGKKLPFSVCKKQTEVAVSILHLLIVQTEGCLLSVCKRIKQNKRTCTLSERKKIKEER
jgi:hypothetical protein